MLSSMSYVEVEVAVGRTLTTAEQHQVTQWISDAEQIIRIGFRRRGWDPAAVDIDTLDLVIREVVADRVKNPEPRRTSREVAVDDGRVVDRYDATAGHLAIDEQWWDLLAPVPRAARGAFSISPSYTPDVRTRGW